MVQENNQVIEISFLTVQAKTSSEIERLLEQKDGEGAISLTKSSPQSMVWKDSKWYNYTLLHHGAREGAVDFIASVFEVNTVFNVVYYDVIKHSQSIFGL